MPGPKYTDPAISRLHYFGVALREAREAESVTQDAFAGLVPCDGSVVSRVETGDVEPSDRFLGAALKRFPALAEPVNVLRLSRKWEGAAGPVPKWFEDYLQAEHDAHTVRIWQPLLVPGPFQTHNYARELFQVEKPDLIDEGLDAHVAARLKRQAIFEKPKAPHTWVVLDEAVLHRRVGSAKVMHEQLLQLGDMSVRPSISLQVIPADSRVNPGLAGSFQIASVDGKPDMMLREAVVEDQTTERGRLVRKVTVVFERLRGYALACEASRDLILKVAEEKWNI
jgi:transcriptional regulator with XRE-family HTH domain